MKENIRHVDVEAILNKVINLPISTWNYTRDPNDTTHMGPMAQDFHAAFGLGSCDKSIAGMDKDGVALAAIQGLNQKLEAKEKTIEQLQETLARQDKAIVALTRRLQTLETQLASPPQ